MANIFKLDKPISRKYFIITLGILLFYTIFTVIVLTCARYFLDINKITAIIIYIIAILSCLTLFYINWINYVKRIWDLTKNKQKSIFYVSAWFIASFAMGFIPVLRYVGIIISLAIFAICIFLPQLPNFTEDKNSTEE